MAPESAARFGSRPAAREADICCRGHTRRSDSSDVEEVMYQPVRRAGAPAFEALEGRQMLSVSVKVNFQPPGAPVPPGYVADTGTTYRDQGNGFTYGWDVANAASRDRNRLADQRYDTLIHTQSGGSRTWALKVPNGTYSVRLVAGDPSYNDSVFRFNLEGQLALSGTPTS